MLSSVQASNDSSTCWFTLLILDTAFAMATAAVALVHCANLRECSAGKAWIFDLLLLSMKSAAQATRHETLYYEFASSTCTLATSCFMMTCQWGRTLESTINNVPMCIAGAVITIDESHPDHAQVLFFSPQRHNAEATEQAIRGATGIDLYVSHPLTAQPCQMPNCPHLMLVIELQVCRAGVHFASSAS